MIFLKCKIRFIYVGFNCKRKKWGKKMSENLCHQGGGVGRLMANAILNFHFDYWHPSLTHGPRMDVICYSEVCIFFCSGLVATLSRLSRFCLNIILIDIALQIYQILDLGIWAQSSGLIAFSFYGSHSP